MMRTARTCVRTKDCRKFIRSLSLHRPNNPSIQQYINKEVEAEGGEEGGGNQRAPGKKFVEFAVFHPMQLYGGS